MINGNFSRPKINHLTAILAGAALGLTLTGCEAIKEKPGQIRVPVGADVYPGDRHDQVIVTTSKEAAPAVDCGRADKSILGFRLPVELGGREVHQSDPKPDKTYSPGYVDTICTDELISEFKIEPVKVYLKTVTVTNDR